MEIVSSLIGGLGSLAKRSGRSLRVRVWAVALALAALLPMSANAQALNLDFGMVRGTTSKNVCTTNTAWGTYWFVGATSSNPAFKVTWAGGPFAQWQYVCFTVQFDASKAVSGANAGYLQVQYVQQEYGVPLTFGINANVRYSQPIHAFIAPKYQILGVTYAPPGHASNVVYGSSAKTGSTTTRRSVSPPASAAWAGPSLLEYQAEEDPDGNFGLRIVAAESAPAPGIGAGCPAANGGGVALRHPATPTLLQPWTPGHTPALSGTSPPHRAYPRPPAWDRAVIRLPDFLRFALCQKGFVPVVCCWSAVDGLAGVVCYRASAHSFRRRSA